ncbi:uncharacterized protein LOC112464534 isoform X1 [Temnothorax curvispinosus]|uniref:Uncharacterized protein LOC112464534 isoform X1 n=1 Tax=Temnothorax curvispinosus TaxID=300111 RepID=A0A6J1QYE2_9HYME|nr:uncharacterized protein LOC112464534 isoform X1 [Temnothorax curvispinosus]
MRPFFEDETPIKTPEPSTAKPSSPEVKVINMSSSDECIRKERDVEKPDESPVKKIEIAVQTALEPTCPAENKDVQVELPEKGMHVPHPSRDATARVSDPIESTITPETDDGNNNLTSSENVTSPMKRFSRSQSDSCLTSQEKTKCLDTPDAATIRVDVHMNEFVQDETDASQETRVSIDASAESSQTVSGPNDEGQSTEQSSSKVCIYKNPQCKLLHMKLDDIHDYALKNCTERLQKYQDLQNLYTERIASLTDLIEKVRNEQKDMDFSLISPSDNTSLMQISTPKLSCNDAQAVRRWSDPIEAIHALLGRTLLESQRIMRGSEAASRNETLCDAEIQAITSTPRSKLVDTVKTHVQESKVVEGRTEPKINSNEKFNIHLSQVEMQQKPQARSATKTSGRDFYPPCIFSFYEKEVVEFVEKLNNLDEIIKQSENLDKASTDFVALKKNDESQNRVSSFKELDPKESASLKREKDDSITEELASTSGTAKENDFIPILTEIPKISRSGNVTSISARPKFPVISLNRLDRKKKEMDEVMEYFQEKKVREKKKKKATSEESEDDEVEFILYRKKKELDDLIMKCLQAREKGKKKAASEESEDDEVEKKDGSEKEEEKEKKLAKRNYIKKTPNKRKKESSDDEESASASDDDTSDEDYTPQKSYYISKKSKLGKKGKKKGRGKNKKTPGSTAKKGDSDKDKGYFTLTPELAAVVGVKQMRCYEVVKEIWSILKKRNLFDPKDKRYAFCDDELLRVFGEKRILAFGMMKYLKNHMKLKHKSL